MPRVLVVLKGRVLKTAAACASIALLALAPSARPGRFAPGALRQSLGSFDAEYARLKQGRAYSKEVARGTLKKRHGIFNYWLVIPDTYDPAKKYQARVQLHGGVMRQESTLRGDGSVRLAGAEQIYISPAGWSEAPWWTDQQAASLRAILDDVKRDYNVDENRVVVSGVSDGGTGAYFIAMRDTTPYASFLPLNVN